MTFKIKNLTDFLNTGAKPLSFAEFNRIIHEIAQILGVGLEKTSAADVTPNFHTAVFKFPAQTVGVFVSAVFPAIAFGQVPAEGICKILFIDHFELTEKFETFFPQFTVFKRNELNVPLSDLDLSIFDDLRRKEIEYWKPQTLGELVFNWWD